MTKVVFKSYNPNDSLLLPPCLGDYLPQNHKARVVSAIIDRLDISDIESGYKGGGTSSYNPRMLLKVIVYAYLNNVYSGRQMEKLLVENIAYMWLSGMQTPDFRTINLFRSKRLSGCFDSIFTQIVVLLHDEGLVSLNVQYIDGTKIESAANKGHNSIGSLCHRFPVSREERLYAVSDGGYPGAGVGDFFHGHELDAYLAAC